MNREDGGKKYQPLWAAFDGKMTVRITYWLGHRTSMASKDILRASKSSAMQV